MITKLKYYPVKIIGVTQLDAFLLFIFEGKSCEKLLIIIKFSNCVKTVKLTRAEFSFHQMLLEYCVIKIVKFETSSRYHER